MTIQYSRRLCIIRACWSCLFYMYCSRVHGAISSENYSDICQCLWGCGRGGVGGRKRLIQNYATQLVIIVAHLWKLIEKQKQNLRNCPVLLCSCRKAFNFSDQKVWDMSPLATTSHQLCPLLLQNDTAFRFSRCKTAASSYLSIGHIANMSL